MGEGSRPKTNVAQNDLKHVQAPCKFNINTMMESDVFFFFWVAAGTLYINCNFCCKIDRCTKSVGVRMLL